MAEGWAPCTILTKGYWEQALQAYLAEVLFVDTMAGALIDALDASPSRNNTYVILTSDNGWYLGEEAALAQRRAVGGNHARAADYQDPDR